MPIYLYPLLIAALAASISYEPQILNAIAAGVPAPSSSACGSGFAHCRSITWDATQAGTADTSTFAGLVSAAKTDWATVANGGAVQNTVSQTGGSFTGTIPADFIFATNSTCATAVAGWEFESYTASSGALIAWVNIGTLSHTTNTTIYACYGKASVTTQQNTVSSTWDTNYVAVYHFAGSVSVVDSTGNSHTLTNVGPVTSTAGQIGNGANVAASGYLYAPTVSLGATTVSMEAWAFSSTMSTMGTGMIVEHSPVNGSWEMFNSSGTLIVRGGDLNNEVDATTLANSTWTYTGATITGTSGVGYIQGVATSHAVDAFTDASNDLNIGSYDRGSSEFNGVLDEVRVSKIVRSSSYFTANYNQQKASQTMVAVGSEQ